MKDKLWLTYEEVARYLLSRFRDDFGLDRVEPKQCLPGASGTSWEIDAKGVSDANDSAVVVVECRRRTRRPTQEAVAALAFKLQDTGAVGGILVTPLALQRGAAKVAAHANIVEVRLDSSSTPEEFGMSFLSKLLRQTAEHISVVDAVTAALEDQDRSHEDVG